MWATAPHASHSIFPSSGLYSKLGYKGLNYFSLVAISPVLTKPAGVEERPQTGTAGKLGKDGGTWAEITLFLRLTKWYYLCSILNAAHLLKFLSELLPFSHVQHAWGGSNLGTEGITVMQWSIREALLCVNFSWLYYSLWPRLCLVYFQGPQWYLWKHSLDMEAVRAKERFGPEKREADFEHYFLFWISEPSLLFKSY